MSQLLRMSPERGREGGGRKEGKKENEEDTIRVDMKKLSPLVNGVVKDLSDERRVTKHYGVNNIGLKTIVRSQTKTGQKSFSNL